MFQHYLKHSSESSAERTEIAAILRSVIAMPIFGSQKSQRFPRQEKAMLHCDLRVRWKVASDLRFRAAISESETPSFWRLRLCDCGALRSSA